MRTSQVWTLPLRRAKISNILAGAAVLAHSLRDAGTTKKLVAMITPDTLSADTVTELKVGSPTSGLDIFG
jgi:hypothetical protein